MKELIYSLASGFIAYFALRWVYSTILYWRLKVRAQYWEEVARVNKRKVRRLRRELSMVTLDLLKHKRFKSKFISMIKEGKEERDDE